MVGLLQLFNNSAHPTFRFAVISDRFSITPDGQRKHEQAITGKSQQFAGHIEQSGPFQDHIADDPDQVINWIDQIHLLGPNRHALDWSKESAHDDEDDQEEETDEQYLLLGLGNGRHEEADTHNQEEVERSKYVEREDISPEG